MHITYIISGHIFCVSSCVTDFQVTETIRFLGWNSPHLQNPSQVMSTPFRAEKICIIPIYPRFIERSIGHPHLHAAPEPSIVPWRLHWRHCSSLAALPNAHGKLLMKRPQNILVEQASGNSWVGWISRRHVPSFSGSNCWGGKNTWTLPWNQKKAIFPTSGFSGNRD